MKRATTVVLHTPEPGSGTRRYVYELARALTCGGLWYTRFCSGSGIAGLALSNAKPIVATSTGRPGDLLRAAELGIQTSDATVAPVEHALGSARAGGPDELARLPNRANYLLENCSWRGVAQKTGALYQGSSATRNQAA